MKFWVTEYSFKGYLLRVYYMPETFLGTGGCKTYTGIPACMDLIYSLGKRHLT